MHGGDELTRPLAPLHTPCRLQLDAAPHLLAEVLSARRPTATLCLFVVPSLSLGLCGGAEAGRRAYDMPARLTPTAMLA